MLRRSTAALLALCADVSRLPDRLRDEWHPVRNAALLQATHSRIRRRGAPDVPEAHNGSCDAPVAISPQMVHEAWWRCAAPGCGHEWVARVRDRVADKSAAACPRCAAQNLLINTHPAIAADFDASRNGGLSLHQLRADASEPVWWACAACSSSWRESPRSRVLRTGSAVRSAGCPSCTAALGVTSGAHATTLAEVPHLALECALPANEDASSILLDDRRMLRWRCARCEAGFTASVFERHRLHRRCPSCSGEVLTPRNSLLLQRPDVARSVASFFPRELLERLTVTDRTVVPFVCRSCGGQFRMSVRERVIRKCCPMCKFQQDAAARESGQHSRRVPSSSPRAPPLERMHTAKRYLDLAIRN